MSQNSSATLDSTVEVLYNYESTSARGHSINVRPGERYSLVSDTNESWWYVARESDVDDGFYLPRSYVKSLSEDPSESFPNFRPRLFDPNESIDSDGGQGNCRKSQLFSADGYKLLTSSGPNDGSLRKTSRHGAGGFKLADPKRISKSIPVDLNFVHNIPDLAAQQRLAERLGEDIEEDSALESFTAVPRNRVSGPEKSCTSSSSSQNKKILGELSIGELAHEKVNGVSTQESRELSSSPSETVVYPAEICYENLEETRRRGRPPIPSPDDVPTRVVHGDWEEFREPSGRTYFYHRHTGVSTWKPPRSLVIPPRLSVSKQSSGDELDSSFSADDLERSQDEMGHPFLSHSLETGGTFDETEELDDAPSEAAPPLPHQLSQSPLQRDRSFTKEECWDSQPSSSLTTSSDSAGSSRGMGRSAAYISNKGYCTGRESQDAFSYSEDCALQPRRRSSEETENLEEKGRTGTLSHGRSFHQQKSVKYGLINKCRFMEGGRRCKKQWVSLYAYLTSAHLIFYRDEKSAQKKGNHYAAPIGVCDLRGAKISWLEGTVTKRKHVFQLELIDGMVDFFNTDDSQEVNSWYHAIRQSIVKLPQPDLYPSPFSEVSPTTAQRSHNRTDSLSGSTGYGYISAVSSPPKSHRDAAPLTPSGSKVSKKEKQKKPQASAAQAAVVNTCDSPGESRASILEKLRRFFRTRPSIDSLKEKGIYKPEPVFGSSLEEICKREKQSVPKFLLICTQTIEEKGVTADGLYRITGNLSQVQKIRCQVDQERYNHLLGEDDVHVLTGALKLFFRELQEPLFPLSMTKDFLAAIKIQNMKQRRGVFKDLLSKMPRVHHDSLCVLLQHLLKVADHASENRMQVHNLAIVFGPTLFSTGNTNSGPIQSQGAGKTNGKKQRGAKSEPAQVQSNSHLAFSMIMQGQIVEYLLKEYTKLF